MMLKKLYDTYGAEINAEPGESIDSLSIPKIRELFGQYSVLLFRGFEMPPESFDRFSSRVGHDFFQHMKANLRPALNADGTITAVLPGNEGLDLHGELYYLPKTPEACWFYCVTPPNADGETTTCDGIRFFESLSRSTRDLLLKNEICYWRILPRESWVILTRKTTIAEAAEVLGRQNGVSNVQIADDEMLVFNYTRSALNRARAQNELAFINNILVLQQYGHLKVSNVKFKGDVEIPDDVLAELRETGDSLADCTPWRKDDVILIDNSRILHGRRSFSGPRDIRARFGMMKLK